MKTKLYLYNLFKVFTCSIFLLGISSQEAHAYVWYSGVWDELRTGYDHGSFPFDMDGDGQNDFSFDHQSLQCLGVTTLENSMFFSDNQSELLPLLNGEIIDSIPSDGHSWYNGSLSMYCRQGTTEDDTVTTGPWQGIDHGMFGISFETGGETHYGWVRLSTGFHPDDYTHYMLHDWAYETQPGIGIITGVVPEPSTWALFLCGGIALLVRLRQGFGDTDQT